LNDWRSDRIAAAERGENPTVLARMRSGYAVIGDTQFLPGYCVLLAAPKVSCLEELPLSARTDFLLDMSRWVEGANSVSPVRPDDRDGSECSLVARSGWHAGGGAF